jgi:3-hydroxypropanoate dehydrogenase
MANIQDADSGTSHRSALGASALDQLFRTARTYNGWRSEPIPAALIQNLYDLLKWGPTATNSCPGRFLFLTTPEARARLAPFLLGANRAKTMAAPVCVIVAHDLAFADKLPVLFPHVPGIKAWFADPAMAEATAFRNGTLQGAYLLMAARSLGLDCGPMSGFDHKGVDQAFFPDSTIRSNFLCNLGYGADESLLPRLPRPSFDEACAIL